MLRHVQMECLTGGLICKCIKKFTYQKDVYSLYTAISTHFNPTFSIDTNCYSPKLIKLEGVY